MGQETFLPELPSISLVSQLISAPPPSIPWKLSTEAEKSQEAKLQTNRVNLQRQVAKKKEYSRNSASSNTNAQLQR